jgi:hypothetical protein
MALDYIPSLRFCTRKLMYVLKDHCSGGDSPDHTDTCSSRVDYKYHYTEILNESANGIKRKRTERVVLAGGGKSLYNSNSPNRFEID